MLDYRIKTFLTLCNTKSYTKSAKELNLTQPAVTQHIKHLESHYNTHLFYFDKKRVLQLTDHGEKLRRFALRVDSDMNRLLNDFSISHNAMEEIKIGTIQTMGESITPLIVASYLQKYPAKKVSIQLGESEELLHLLEKGAIHLCLTDVFCGRANFESHELFTSKTICLCDPHHPLANQTIDFNELNDYRLIFRENDTYLRRNLSMILHGNNQDHTNFSSYIEAGTINAVKQLVANGLGITFLYEFVAREELKAGKLKEIYIREFHTDAHFNIAWMKNSFYSQDNLQLLSECKDVIGSYFTY